MFEQFPPLHCYMYIIKESPLILYQILFVFCINALLKVLPGMHVLQNPVNLGKFGKLGNI